MEPWIPGNGYGIMFALGIEKKEDEVVHMEVHLPFQTGPLQLEWTREQIQECILDKTT